MQPSKHKLRILWHSVAGQIRSGYGKVTNNVTSRLVRLGWDIIVSAYYGIEPGGSLIINGVPTVPSKLGGFGKDSCINHFKNLQRDIAILHTDWWAFPWFPKIPNTVLYSPMDHANYPPDLIQHTKNFTYVVSLCEWQQEVLRKQNVQSTLLPHGVDTKIYKPIDMKEARKITLLPKNRYIIGIVGANSDKEGRKGWGPMFKALRLFLDENPDVKDILVVAHSNPFDPRGLPLTKFVEKQKLSNVVKFKNPRMNEIGLREEEMNLLYNSFNVLLHPSMREGFGLCIAESQSAGTPVIATNFSSMVELVKGHGWLVKGALDGLNIITTPINADTQIPDVYDIVKCIKDAYFHPKKVERYGKSARKFMLKYDWDKIAPKWDEFLTEVEKEVLAPQDITKRKLF